MNIPPLPDALIEPLVRNALNEDLGSVGDITTNAIIPHDRLWKGAFVARKDGVAAGNDLARKAFQLLDPTIKLDLLKPDGALLRTGDTIATVSGPAAAIIIGERVALNFMCHLSGIATATYKMVEAAKPHKARISDTRKTTPGLRILEKYAVLAGGGINHRFGLYDAVLIKDNHIAVAGGIGEAVMKARAAVGPEMKIEVEVDTLDQLKQLLDLPINRVLFDNMDNTALKKAVAMVAGRFVTEASGGVTLNTVHDIAASGVDIISIGAITHSAPILDIGLDEVI